MLEFVLASTINSSDLNSQLLEAVCTRNWTAAVTITHHMIKIAPAYQFQLNQYAQRLSYLSLINSQFVSPSCSNLNTPSLPVSSPPQVPPGWEYKPIYIPRSTQ